MKLIISKPSPSVKSLSGGVDVGALNVEFPFVVPLTPFMILKSDSRTVTCGRLLLTFLLFERHVARLSNTRPSSFEAIFVTKTL